MGNTASLFLYKWTYILLSTTTNYSSCQYVLHVSVVLTTLGHNNHLPILKEFAIAHKYIRRQRTRVTVRILTTSRQNRMTHSSEPHMINIQKCLQSFLISLHTPHITRVGTLIVATFYLQLIQNRYMFRPFTLLRLSSGQTQVV